MRRIEYDYIYLAEVPGKTKTSVWECRNNRSDDILGHVRWYAPWRQYCFYPNTETVFNKGCMNDICRFIDRLMRERKNAG